MHGYRAEGGLRRLENDGGDEGNRVFGCLPRFLSVFIGCKVDVLDAGEKQDVGFLGIKKSSLR